MNTKVDKLDVDKSIPVPVNLSKLSDVVKNDVVRKTEYDVSVKKLNNIKAIYISNLVKISGYEAKIVEIQKKKLYYDQDRYITTQKFNKLTSTKFLWKITASTFSKQK